LKICITGSAGYVASWLAQALIKKNHEVTLIDNYRTPSHLILIENIPIGKVDIRDITDLSKFDVLFHLAGVSGIKECEDNKDEAFDINVRGTFNLLKTFKGRIIFASTSAVYGEAKEPEIDESHPTVPRSWYGQNKFDAENIVKLHSNYCILRFSNIFGKGYICKRTVADLFIENALKKESIQIHGDGKQRRDFVHLNDAIRAYLLAMKSDINGIFNIGGNEALNINEIAELTAKTYRKLFDGNISIEHIPIDCGILWKDFIYSSLKAKTILGYEPMYSISDEISERLTTYAKQKR